MINSEKRIGAFLATLKAELMEGIKNQPEGHSNIQVSYQDVQPGAYYTNIPDDSRGDLIPDRSKERVITIKIFGG